MNVFMCIRIQFAAISTASKRARPPARPPTCARMCVLRTRVLGSFALSRRNILSARTYTNNNTEPRENLFTRAFKVYKPPFFFFLYYYLPLKRFIISCVCFPTSPSHPIIPVRREMVVSPPPIQNVLYCAYTSAISVKNNKKTVLHFIYHAHTGGVASWGPGEEWQCTPGVTGNLNFGIRQIYKSDSRRATLQCDVYQTNTHFSF